MSEGLLVLISAPSGAGKTSLVAAALEHDPRLVVSISHTTRPRRPQEHEGLNYYFVDDAEFSAMASDNQFLEHAVVFGKQYGTARAPVQALRAQGKDVILEIDWQGADLVQHEIPDALSIFVLPPSTEVLRERLTRRAQDSAPVIESRLAEARKEMAQSQRYQYIVVNDDFDRALGDILAILQSARLRSSQQVAHNPQVKAILSPT